MFGQNDALPVAAMICHATLYFLKLTFRTNRGYMPVYVNGGKVSEKTEFYDIRFTFFPFFIFVLFWRYRIWGK